MTERRTNLIFAGLIVAAIVGAFLLIIPASPVSKEPVLGLDLQGGLEVVLKAVPPEGRPLQESDLDRSVEIIRERIDKLGVAEPEVRKQGDDQISVELPGVRNADRARDIIGQTAKLELFDLATALTGPSVNPQTFQAVPIESLYDLLVAPETTSLARDGEAGPDYLFETETKKRLAGPLRSQEAILATEAAKKAGVKDGKLPEGYRILAVPNETVVVTCGQNGDFCPPGFAATGDTFYYLFKHTPDAEDVEERFPQMTGDDLRLSGTRQDFDPQTGEPIVTMSFTDEGEDIFGTVTRLEATPRRSTRASRSCSTARSARSRRSTSSATRRGSAAATVRRSAATSPSTRRRTSRWCCRRARCRSSSSRSRSRRSRPRSARTRCGRR